MQASSASDRDARLRHPFSIAFRLAHSPAIIFVRRRLRARMGFYIPSEKRSELLKYKYSSTDKSLTSVSPSSAQLHLSPQPFFSRRPFLDASFARLLEKDATNSSYAGITRCAALAMRTARCAWARARAARAQQLKDCRETRNDVRLTMLTPHPLLRTRRNTS